MRQDSDMGDLRAAPADASPPGGAADDSLDSLDSLENEGFEEGDAYEADMGDESLAASDASEDFGEEDAHADLGDEETEGFELDMAAGADALEVWNAFEDEIANSLDALDTDEFIGRILGGLGRAVSVVGRGRGPAPQAAAMLARVLGAGQAAPAKGRAANAARTEGTIAARAGDVALAPSQRAASLGHLFGQLGQLMGRNFDDLEAFDAAADLYIDEGLDEALPAAVALGARAVARGLGLRNVAQMTMPARRALVRAIATSARDLIFGRGPQSLRALPRMGQAVARTARRRRLPPAAAAQAVRRALPRTARTVARRPRLARRLATPAAGPRPIARPSSIGRGTPGPGPRARRYTFSGPVTLTITGR
jgi:hypothetical protein